LTESHFGSKAAILASMNTAKRAVAAAGLELKDPARKERTG
jgi:hypothetical protein